MYMHVYVYMYMYMHTHSERERERERAPPLSADLALHVHVYTYKLTINRREVDTCMHGIYDTLTPGIHAHYVAELVTASSLTDCTCRSKISMEYIHACT